MARIRTFWGAAVLRVWFFLLTCLVAIYALLLRPSASPAFTPYAQTGDYIQGAALSLPQTMAAPLPLMVDRDIQQPPNYVPHVMPGEEPSTPEPVEPIPDTAPELEVFPEEPLEGLDPGVDYSDEWYIPPEAYNSWVITPENTPPSVVPPLGYSGSMEPSTELEYLAAINTNLSMIFYSITLIIAVGVVYLICRIVWPFFSGL